MADAADLKSASRFGSEGSSPFLGTISRYELSCNFLVAISLSLWVFTLLFTSSLYLFLRASGHGLFPLISILKYDGAIPSITACFRKDIGDITFLYLRPQRGVHKDGVAELV